MSYFGSWTPAPLCTHQWTWWAAEAARIETPLCAYCARTARFHRRQCSVLVGANVEQGARGKQHRDFISDVCTQDQHGSGSKPPWCWCQMVLLQHIHTGLIPPAAYECGTEEQTAWYIVQKCPNQRPPCGAYGLAALDDKTINCMAAQCMSRSPTWLRGMRTKIDSKRRQLFSTTTLLPTEPLACVNPPNVSYNSCRIETGVITWRFTILIKRNIWKVISS